MAEDIVTVAAQQITQGDYMGAMATFEEHITSSLTTHQGTMGGQRQLSLRYKKMETSMIRETTE